MKTFNKLYGRLVLESKELDKSKVISILKKLEKIANFQVIGGAAWAIHTNYKTKDIDVVVFWANEKAPEIVMGPTGNGRNLEAIGASIGGVSIDFLRSGEEYNRDFIIPRSFETVKINGLEVATVPELFEMKRNDEALMSFIKSSDVGIDWGIKNMKSTRSRRHFASLWYDVHSENWEDHIEDIRKIK